MSAPRARWAVAFGAAVAVSALLAATGWLAPAALRPAVRAPDACTVLQAENTGEGAPTTLRLLSLPGGFTKRLTEVGYWINAMGYSAAQDVVYGVADGDRHGRFHDGAHAVRIDHDGDVTDLGVIGREGPRHPVWSQVTGATAGAIDGDRWYVRQGGDLYAVDIDPASASYLRVVHRTPLRPVSLALGVDDFAHDPADGLLYGVSTSSRGDGSVVTLDPATGRVAVVPGPQFPPGGAYGSVVLGPGALYATANRVGHRSVTYRLPRDHQDPAVEVATGPALVSADAAGCYTEAPAPPPTTPTTPTTPTPPPPTTSSPPPPTTSSSPTPQPTSGSPTPQPVPPTPPAPPPEAEPPELPPPPRPPPVEQPAAVPVTPAPPPGPSAEPPASPEPPSPSPRVRPKPVAEASPKNTGMPTEEKRRWGLTALILVLGGGAAVASRRHR